MKKPNAARVRLVKQPTTAAGPATTTSETLPGHATLTFVLTALGAFIASLDLSIVNVAFPAIHRSFSHDSQADLAWILTGYSIMFGALLVTGGRTGDRIGRRRTFFLGLTVFGVGSALCGLAPTVPLLVGGRVLQGAGAAFALPSSLGLLLAAFPGERRSQMVALWGGIGALAVATGPSLGAVLVTEWGWRLVFYVNIPVCLVTIIAGRRILVEAPRPPTVAGRSDYLGVLLLTAGLGAIVLGVSEGGTWGWAGGRTIGTLLLGIVLLPTFVWRSSRHANPVLDLSLFRSRTLTLADTATVIYSMGFFALLLGNILFLTGVWDYSILRAGLSVTPGPLVVAVVAGPAGRLASRVGFRPVLIAGAGVFTFALLWYVFRVGAHPAYVTEWLPATLLGGLGIALTFPVISAAAVSSLPPQRFAVGSAINQTARQIGGALGIAVLVAILGTATGPSALHAFRHLWIFEACTAAVTGLVVSQIRPAPRPA
jgi:EmrB/QacA subfamily drug resistance transporter